MFKTISLSDLILGAFQREGAFIEPPAFGVHEILLPDEAAERFGTDPHRRIVFAPDLPPDGDSTTVLHFGHPLVETVIASLRRQPAVAQLFINNVRLEKPRLYESIEKALSFPNARLFRDAHASERQRLRHYAVFTFRVSLIADEKRERILTLWMDVQGGHPVDGIRIEPLAAIEAECAWNGLESSAVAWTSSPETNPASESVLRSLLDRARVAAREALGETLHELQSRLHRHLELDRVRLDQYYGDLAADLDRRISRADSERQISIRTKREAVEAERAVKLQDAEKKYSLRIELDLAAVAIVAQPKLELDVEIRKRSAAVRRTTVWDPLLHRIEPLVCDVCGRPGYSLLLCEGGHLAHEACMAPQCVDCKRAYCRRCADQVEVCTICGRPVCRHSRVCCGECGRVTCQAHAGQCHAAATPSQPAAQKTTASRTKPQTSNLPNHTAASASGSQAKKFRRREMRPANRDTSRSHWVPPNAESREILPAEKTRGDRINVFYNVIDESLRAVVYRRGHPVCERSWHLIDEGILTECRCETGKCREDGMVYRPAEDDGIKAQMEWFVRLLMLEYTVPEEYMRFFNIRKGETHEEKRIRLGGLWKDEAVLAEIRAEFDSEDRRRKDRGSPS